MITGVHWFHKDPQWFLKGELIENVKSLDILGVSFDADHTAHANVRLDKCK